MKIYHLFGLLPTERLHSEAVRAASEKAAKAKLRRRCKGIRSIMLSHIEEAAR